MSTLPEIIKNHIAIANPYRITHAHGVVIAQIGKIKITPESEWKKIKVVQSFEYPTIEFNLQSSYFLHTHTEGIRNEVAYLKSKAYGLTNINEQHSVELFQSNLIYYLSSFAWMPWAFTSDHLIITQLDEHFVSVALKAYPDIVGVFQFTEQGRMVSFNADRYRYQNGEFSLSSWKIEYGKYNIKKSYKVPTQARFYWVEPEKTEYLELEKITEFTVL